MIVEQANGNYTDFRIPGIVVTKNGTLLRYCECRKGDSDWADIDIKISRSENEGLNWETVLLIENENNTLNNPVMFVDGKQLIFLFCKNYKEIWKCVSTDDGKSFSKAVRVNFESSIDFFYNVVAVGPGHGIVHKGRLIVPVWFAYNKEDQMSHYPSFISTLYSDNHGENWQIGELIFKDELINPSECALAVTAQNEVLISIRHECRNEKRGFATSMDGISDWKDLSFNEKIPDPICMGSMTHRDGKIFHINCDSKTDRKNLTVKISDNCFKTFDSIFVSEIAGYSDIAVFENKLYVYYEKSAKNHNNTFEPFTLHFEIIQL